MRTSSNSSIDNNNNSRSLMSVYSKRDDTTIISTAEHLKKVIGNEDSNNYSELEPILDTEFLLCNSSNENNDY